MIVNDLLKYDAFKELTISDGEREIKGVYIGDLLSWVMGKAKCDDAWITIMSNVNILAVATLTDCACIILSENVVPDDEVIETARLKEINLISFAGSSFDAAVLLDKII